MKRRNDKDSQGGRRSNEVGWTKVSFVAWERRDDDWDKMRMRTMEAEGGRCRWQRKGEARRVDRIAEGFPHITPAPLESFSDWVTQLQHLRFSVCQVCSSYQSRIGDGSNFLNHIHCLKAESSLALHSSNYTTARDEECMMWVRKHFIFHLKLCKWIFCFLSIK